jgi:hypothetical protein
MAHRRRVSWRAVVSAAAAADNPERRRLHARQRPANESVNYRAQAKPKILPNQRRRIKNLLLR